MKSLKEICEGVLKSNDANNPRYYFQLYKNAYENPIIGVGLTSASQSENVLDEDELNKLYNKIPSKYRIDFKDIQYMRRYPISTKDEDVWYKFANVVLWCKDEKEIVSIVKKTCIIPSYAQTDIRKGITWGGVGNKLHQSAKNMNSIDVRIYEDKDSTGRKFPYSTMLIYMHDKKDSKEALFWT